MAGRQHSGCVSALVLIVSCYTVGATQGYNVGAPALLDLSYPCVAQRLGCLV